MPVKFLLFSFLHIILSIWKKDEIEFDISLDKNSVGYISSIPKHNIEKLNMINVIKFVIDGKKILSKLEKNEI